MILTDFYKFVKLDELTATRLDCVISTGEYEVFEQLRSPRYVKATSRYPETLNGGLNAYYHKSNGLVRADAHRKSDWALSIRSQHISSIFRPDLELPFSFGDVRETSDALIFVDKIVIAGGKVVKGSVLDVYIARGLAKNCVQLYQMAIDGSLDSEMEQLNDKAEPELQLQD